MRKNAISFNANPLAYFTEKQMEKIHSASMDVLEDAGTIVHHAEARELLKQAGAFPKGGHRVCIPTALTEWAIRRAPSRITLYNREGMPAMFLEGTNVMISEIIEKADKSPS